MPLIYLIGPSGAGKSGIASRTAELLNLPYLDLDTTCVQHEEDWQYCLTAISSFEAETIGCGLVDIGAGTQYKGQGIREFLEKLKPSVVLITANPREAYERCIVKTGWLNRSISEYIETEYTSREPLYMTANHVITVIGTDWDQAVMDLTAIVQKCFQ